MSDFNDRIIAEFRDHRGIVGHDFGDSLVLLHTIGARTGTPRVNPVMALPDDGDWLVVASAAGAAHDPAWMANLRARPDVVIEVPTLAPDGDGIDEVSVHAVELRGPARDEAFARFVDRSETFADYQDRAGDRVLPVVRLVRA